MISIHKQLRRYFVLVAIIAVLVIFLLSNLGMAFFFNSYVKKADLHSDQKIVKYLEDLLRADREYGLQANMGSMPGLVQFIRGEEAEIKLYTLSGSLLLDSLAMGNMHGMMGRGTGRSPGMGNGPGMGNDSGLPWQQGTQESSNAELVFRDYPLQLDGSAVGRVAIGREKTILFSAQDRSFFLTMNAVYLIALGLAVLLAFLMSKYVTGKFLKPLLIVKSNIQAVSGLNSLNQGPIKPVSSKTREIQELVLATEELARTIEEQNKLRKRLTSDLAHELRTPLATLQSQLEAMIDGIWEVTPQRLSFCYDELIRLTRLINDLNELSVLESAETQINKTKLDLSKLLNEMMENYKLVFAEKNIEFSHSIQPDIKVWGDGDRLRQIIVNILSNAYKYTGEKGRTTVKLSTENGWAVLEVRDTGRGISPEDLPHIFERFYRGDLSRSRESGGAGIGLTIAKALVEAHQGTLEVESEAGVGTAVRIRLPQ